MLTRPPPPPRTRTTGRATRAALLRRLEPRGPPGPGAQTRPRPRVLTGLLHPPHCPRGDPQAGGDLADLPARGDPPGCLHPRPFTPLLLGGGIPAPLRIPHT